MEGPVVVDEVVTRQGEVSLAALIWSVRQQLHEARSIGQQDPIRLGVDSIQVEVLVEASATDTRSRDGHAGVSLNVLDIVGVDLARTSTQEWESGRKSTARVTVTLTPRDVRDPVHNLTGRFEVAGSDLQSPPRTGS